VLLAAALVLTGCVGERPAVDPPAAGSPATASPAGPSRTAPEAAPEPVALELPDGALRDRVPAPAEVPAGLVPLPEATGPRDATQVAEFSADPAAAAVDLAANGFTDAYVALYAAPGDPRTLTVVVVRFAGADGARADLEADLQASSGDVLPEPVLGEASEVRRLDLPDDPDRELVTVRFRAGSTTWLLAWRAPRPAETQVPVALSRLLLSRAGTS
jgi:hypothetical protein